MALATVVNEDSWKLQSGGTAAGGYESTFQRRIWDIATNAYVYSTKKLTVSYLEVYSEYKHYALTEDACTNYIEAHPELLLQYSRQDEFGLSFTLTKRNTARTNFSYTLADVPETGS
jgi:hypothetical protein